MKRNSSLQKIISILMIFILLTEFTGCYSTKTISPSDISYSDLYMIHCKNVTYSLKEVVIAGELLTGKLDFDKNHKSPGFKTHIYLSTDSILKFSNDLVSLPIKNITRIEQKIPDSGKTRTLTILLIIGGGVCLGIGLIALIGSSIAKGIGSIAFPDPNSSSSTGLCTNW